MLMRCSWIRFAALPALAAALTLAPAALRAGTETDTAAVPDDTRDTGEALSSGNAEPFPVRTAVRALIEKETAQTNLPADIAEAVVFVESRYDSSIVGRVGEIGLMQVRPETAAMLGFRGTTAELARPETNIHYGVTYLAAAWRLAEGDLCRALMKYRAGHGEETMTPRSVLYCNRARDRLLAMNSQFATSGAVATVTPNSARASVTAAAQPRPTDVYSNYKRGTTAASRAF